MTHHEINQKYLANRRFRTAVFDFIPNGDGKGTLVRKPRSRSDRG